MGGSADSEFSKRCISELGSWVGDGFDSLSAGAGAGGQGALGAAAEA